MVGGVLDGAMSPRSKRKDDVVAQLEDRQAELRSSARRLLGVTDAPLPRATPAWVVAAPLGGLAAAAELQALGVLLLGPEIARSLGTGRAGLAFLLIVRTLALSIAALGFVAFVQGRARRASVSIVTGFAAALVTLFTAFATTAGAVLGLLVLNGVLCASVEAVHRPLLVDSLPPGLRARALSMHRGGWAAGLVLGPAVVGITALAGSSWRAAFLAMGLLSLAAAASSVHLRDPGFGRFDVDEVRRLVHGDVETEPAGLRFFESMRRLLLIPSARRLLATSAILGVAVFPLLTSVFFFLDERWDMGPGARSAFLAGAGACALGVLAWFGRRADARFREGPSGLAELASALLALAAATVVVGVAVPVFVVMVAALALSFAVLATATPALQTLLLSVVPPQMRSHASALSNIFFAGIGGVGGLLLLAGIDRRFGISTALVLLAIPCVVAALVLRSAGRMIDDDLDHMIDDIIEREELGLVHARGGHVPMLACRRLDFSYGQVQVLFDVDFTVDEGEMVALLGTNGAGKSTLLRVISGLGLPSRGSIHYCGSDITFLDAERRVGLGITQVPGGRAVFGPMSVVENLRVFGFSHGRDRTAVEQGIDAALDAFPRLAERRDALASTLSGGEQQMLGLGKAFMLQPRILLIDELSLGLAPRIVAELLEMVRRINAAGTAIVLVEQSVNIALSVVEHAYFMEKGEIRFDGRAADLLGRRDLLRSVFLEGAAR